MTLSLIVYYTMVAKVESRQPFFIQMSVRNEPLESIVTIGTHSSNGPSACYTTRMANHLFLVGYRGTGKSSVGRRLSEILRLASVDSDDLVEQDAGKTIRAIFSEEGEPGFRELETQAIQRIVEGRDTSIVSLGGGAILREQNRHLIKTHGAVIWLKASLDEIARRIFDDTTTTERRPALTQLGERAEIAKLLEVREPMYHEVADFTIVTDHRTVDDIATEIARWYSESQWPETSERVE